MSNPIRGKAMYSPKTQGEAEQNERIEENIENLDWDNMTLQDFEDAFEDRDPLEFL